MTPTPRKVRSGRRQFGPGTEQEWAKVMESPHVKRAFADPAIQQALMQHMAQQAAAAGPAPAAPPAPPVGMAEGGALHFDTGGVNTAAVAEMQQLTQQIATLPEGPQKDQARMRLATLQAQQTQQSVSGITIPGGGSVSSSSMSGMNQMVKPPTVGNTAIATGMGALMGAANTANPGKGALLGAGLAGGLSYLIRKYGKGAQQQKAQQQGTSGGAGGIGGSSSGYGSSGVPQTALHQRPADYVPPAGAGTGTTSTEVPVAEAWNPNWRNKQDVVTQSGAATQQPGVTLPSPTPTGSTPPGSGGLMMGTANSKSGTVISRDGGKTWVDSQDNKPYTDPVKNQSQIDPGSSLTGASPVTTPPTESAPNVDLINTPWSPPAPSPSLGTGSGLAGSDSTMGQVGQAAGMEGLDEEGLARGGPVPPSGLGALSPVLHIVIAPKPKLAPKKASLVPPLHGPQDHGPRPHGRVQVPRGSGAAIKGKRFGGIY